MPSIAIVANVYNEAHALPGLIENARAFGDDLFVLHTGPGGKFSTDGTIEILEKAGVRHKFDDIHKGFGAIRTRLIREAACDWALITDADERWFLEEPILTCHGTEKYPEQKNPALTTTQNGTTRPKELLHALMKQADARNVDAIRLSRRHWMKEPGDWTHPCQNWSVHHDWQLRIIRNSPFLFYDPSVRMHERILDSRTWSEPSYVTGDTHTGPFQNHYHIHFKKLDGKQNKEDAQVYEDLDKGVVAKMWLETTMKD